MCEGLSLFTRMVRQTYLHIYTHLIAPDYVNCLPPPFTCFLSCGLFNLRAWSCHWNLSLNQTLCLCDL
ncbi:Hypothetical predicted protein [Octopus vulgaris]|uniref:Uncharacterized protein n=1 Tax=Octopus vulgaris TaxID=6645 RepID=A0AA36F7G6_OCTVU|nr:Hypothetical predicted protein [Octopus vulgaris]